MSEDTKAKSEVIDWSQFSDKDVPEEEMPRWARAITLGNEQRVRDIVRSARTVDEDLRREEFSREEVLILDWKIEQLKSKLATRSSNKKNSCSKEKCGKCQH